ncbi:MAG: DNRLRE domain-containing protein [Bacteroidales bacterium]|nr:DNRLRE domain-containing protein [Bacteroidales bacterium]
MKKFYFTLAVLFLGFTVTKAQTVSVYPTDDMTTQTGSSGMMPTSEEFWVANWDAMQNYHQTLIKFDLSQYSGQTIISATLKIYQHYHAPDGSPTPSKIFAITEDWDENTWTTSNNVIHGSTEYSTPTFTSTLEWYEIDITSLVNEWLDETISNYGLVIIADLNTKFAKFYSKEVSDTTKRPYLELSGVSGIVDINKIVSNLIIFPNPVKESANIEFSLSSVQNVEISIFNIIGEKIEQISNEKHTAGLHSEKFSRRNLKDGIYFVQIKIKNSIFTHKIIFY